MTTGTYPPARKRRGTVFFLDTKSTCFLCLSETPTLIDLEEENVEKKPEKSQQQFNMRVIHKYLKLHAGKLLTTKITGGSSNDQLMKTDLAVRLCEDCERKTDMVTKLCLELELVQMKVNHWLKQVMDTLQKSEDNQERMLKFRNKMTQPLDLLQVSVTDVMRKEMKAKCKQRLETTDVSSLVINMASGKKAVIKSKSLVSIPSLLPDKPVATAASTPVVFTAPLPPPPQVSSSPAAVTTTTVSRPPIVTSQLAPAAAAPQNTPVPTPISALKDLESQVFKNARFKCPLCFLPFTGMSGFEAHCTRRHPEAKAKIKPIEVTPTIKSAEVAPIPQPVKVAPIIRKTIEVIQIPEPKELKTPTPKPVEVATSTDPVCTDCGLRFDSLVERDRHTRLGCVSRSSVPPPVSTPQNNVVLPPLPLVVPPTRPNWNPLTDPLPHTKTTDGLFQCTLCVGTTHGYTNESQLRNHVICIHSWYFFKPAQFSNCPVPKFYAICEELINKEVAACHHVGTTYYCTYCKAVFYHKRTMNLHLVQNHYADLSVKLKQMQSDRGMGETPTTVIVSPQQTFMAPPQPVERPKTCGDCGKMYDKINSYYQHVNRGSCTQKPANSNNPVRKYKCYECGARFAQSSSASRHRKLNCPARKSTAGLNGLLTPRLEPPGGWAHTCKFCGKGFQKWDNFTKHVQRGKCRTQPDQQSQQAGDNIGLPVVTGAFSLQRISVVPVVIASTSIKPPSMIKESYGEQEQAYYDEEEEEMEMEQEFGDTYGDTTIEVMNAHQGHLGNYEEEDNYMEDDGEMQDTKMFMGDNEMILPDQDPLEF